MAILTEPGTTSPAHAIATNAIITARRFLNKSHHRHTAFLNIMRRAPEPHFKPGHYARNPTGPYHGLAYLTRFLMAPLHQHPTHQLVLQPTTDAHMTSPIPLLTTPHLQLKQRLNEQAQNQTIRALLEMNSHHKEGKPPRQDIQDLPLLIDYYATRQLLNIPIRIRTS